MSNDIHAVTGAFGYSGKYIAKHLLSQDKHVITLTNSLHRHNPFGGRVRAEPFHFDAPDVLAESLRGVSVLYNTYWVRFNQPALSLAQAEYNTSVLFSAAKAAGVERIVHISATNPSENSPMEYYRRKARVERALIESGVSYAILRPSILFGKQDILINNMAWALRRLPFFAVFGDGLYKLQPIHVDDLAGLAVGQGQERTDRIVDAIGPETFTYRELVAFVGRIIEAKRPVLSVPPSLGYAAAWTLGKMIGDVMITRDEIRALMGNMLCVDSAPTGTTRLTDWAIEKSSTLGRRYVSERDRRISVG